DRLYFRLKIFSLMAGDFGIRYLEADRPTFHVITYPDGTSNLPLSQTRRSSKTVDELFHLAIDRVEIKEGVIFWNERPAPLDLTANDLAALMTYAAGDARYDGKINIGKMDLLFSDMRPVAATVEAEFSMRPRSIA